MASSSADRPGVVGRARIARARRGGEKGGICVGWMVVCVMSLGLVVVAVVVVIVIVSSLESGVLL